MRSLPEYDSDRADLARLNAAPWMVDALKMNPSYTYWGPHEDYMIAKDAGWRAPIFVPTWGEFTIGLDELNEVVHFYFQVTRASENCEACDGSGHNPGTKQIADDFYDFAGTGRKWCAAITQDECDALVKGGRLNKLAGCEWDPVAGKMTEPSRAVTAEQVNAANAPGSAFMSDGHHDAINRWILVETRARRLGVFGDCPECEGHGSVFTEPVARLGLVLWLIHPRKGASRGVEVANLNETDVPTAVAFLREAAKRNADRFSKLVDPS